ncbi:MAG: D-aminoacyl-tRNA deacylase [candidate division WOR-3 bacterium]
MRAVLQRVSEAKIAVEGTPVTEIGPGLLVLLGIGHEDNEETCRQLAARIARLRIFDDETGRMNRSLLDVHGAALVVSQFTLYADASRGLRPSFTDACPPARARELCDRFACELGYLGVPVRTGRFGARMAVQLTNEGPVTIVLEEPRRQAS